MSHLCAICALLLSVLHVVFGSSEMEQFENFMLQYNRSYKTREEFKYRLRTFSENLKEASRLQREELGTAQYGVTKFSDLTDEEFSIYHLPTNILPTPPILKQSEEVLPFPTSCDWRTQNVISKAKNQRTCHSCWAFAAVANIEAQWAILGQTISLSEQQVIDCNTCRNGCSGGYAWDAFMTVLQQGGLTSEKSYPYTGHVSNCRKGFEAVGWIHDFEMLKKNETAMASHVAHKGTLTVTINKAPLKHYQKGIVDTLRSNCDPNYVDHVVLIVGYRGGGKLPQWILKNSWGEDWGEKGFFRMFRDKNACGITKYPVTCIVERNKNQKIKRCVPQ
uniref:Cathepsin W n=1 Tax=Xenopus tropicalis TaxID=8364 RepID=A0A6I8PSF6_XENTR